MNEPKFIKYPKIPYLGEKPLPEGDVEIFEKIDGSNCQVRVSQGRILPGSRSHYLTENMWDNPAKLEPLKKWMAYFKKWAMKNQRFYNLPENLIVYGEWTSDGIVEYEPPLMNKFFLIDIGILEGEELQRFMEYESAINCCRTCGLEEVLFLDMFDFGKFRKEDLNNMFTRENVRRLALGSMEGIVIKDYFSTPQAFVKYLSPHYSEIREDNTHIKERGITFPRIRKGFIALSERGINEEDISPEKLAKEVEGDVISEMGVKPDKKTLEKYVSQYLKLRKTESTS